MVWCTELDLGVGLSLDWIDMDITNEGVNMPDSRKWWRWVGVGVVLLLVYYFVSHPLEVTVTGTGEASVPATEAILSLNATEINNSPVVAVGNLESKVATLKQALIENGVEAGEIIESQVAVVPASSVVPGAQGYAASVTLAGPTKQVDQVATLTGLLYERGATVVSQPVLRNQDQKKLEKEALSEALKDARSQAGAIGTRKWKFIRMPGEIVQVDTANTSSFTSESMGEEEGVGVTASDTFKISKVVQVTYRMW